MHASIFEILPFVGPDIARFLGAGLVVGLLVWVMQQVRLRYAALGAEAVVPDRKLSLRGGFEFLVQQLHGLFETVIGHEAHHYTPMLASVFIYVFALNLLGNIPGLPAPTSSLGINAGMAVFIFGWYNWHGYKAHGISYLKHFLGPVWWLAFMMLPIELISHTVRPLSLSIRLTGNINGDHLALGIFQELTPYVVPMFFMALGLFVAFMQAFVFTVLAAVYIRLAVADEH